MLLKTIASRARVVTRRGRNYATKATPIVLPPLPWDRTALEPHISGETIDFHYGKHHAGYVNKLNPQLTAEDGNDVVKLMHKFKKTDQKKFNLAAQIWNHTFYWNCMKPGGGGAPTGKVAAEIEKSFGSYVKFEENFTNVASTLFGSGWAWLVQDNKSDSLKIVGTANAECPLIDGLTPIVVCDVWEHAYYIDRRHDRAKYIEAWWKLVNWNFAEKNLK